MKFTRKFLMKSIAASILPAAFIANTAIAADDNYQAIAKQMKIMNNIMTSAVNDGNLGVAGKVNRIESTYLKGQGVVFTIKASNKKHHFGNFEFVMPTMPVAPIAPEVNAEMAEAFDIDINEIMEESAESYERAMAQFEESRSFSRELREQEREISYELREVERDKRDVNFQLPRASDKDKKALKAQLDELAKKEQQLRKTKREFAQKNSALQAERKQKQQELVKERGKFYQQLSYSLADTLCLYGNGLRALPKGEHVSLIFKSAGDKVERRYQDNIMVFTKKDIMRCASESINSEALVKKAHQYQL